MRPPPKPGFWLVVRREWRWILHDHIALILIFGVPRGFINVMKWGSRAAKLDREINRRLDKAIAVLFMGQYSRRGQLPPGIESMRLTNGRPGFLKKEREDRSGNNRGDIDATGDVVDIQR